MIPMVYREVTTSVWRTEEEGRVGKLKNGKPVDKDVSLERG